MDKQKLKNLVHYVCHKVKDPSKLGKTKLNKVLYYSDFLFYLENYRPITGEIYIKHKHGPVSKNLNQILEELEKEQKVFEREQAVIDFTRHELVSVKRPDISGFTPEEIALIDEIIEIISNDHTAKSISFVTHDEAWEAARQGEEIPYYTILGKESKPSDKAIEWAKNAIEEKFYA
ncbi:MAG TPA: Panacea domain-containing protein [Fodinibius sp.]|nr:Panacea domain-containing protein [Fodinibius sp.]